jgi:hypothetical protein
MTGMEWRSEEIEETVDTDVPFGDALAALAVDTEVDVDAVAAVRESREEI